MSNIVINVKDELGAFIENCTVTILNRNTFLPISKVTTQTGAANFVIDDGTYYLLIDTLFHVTENPYIITVAGDGTFTKTLQTNTELSVPPVGFCNLFGYFNGDASNLVIRYSLRNTPAPIYPSVFTIDRGYAYANNNLVQMIVPRKSYIHVWVGLHDKEFNVPDAQYASFIKYLYPQIDSLIIEGDSTANVGSTITLTAKLLNDDLTTTDTSATWSVDTAYLEQTKPGVFICKQSGSTQIQAQVMVNNQLYSATKTITIA